MIFTRKDYLIFEESTKGQLVLQDLVAKFGNSVFVKGGQDAARQTDFNCGARSVLEYILNSIEAAKNGEQDNV